MCVCVCVMIIIMRICFGVIHHFLPWYAISSYHSLLLLLLYCCWIADSATDAASTQAKHIFSLDTIWVCIFVVVWRAKLMQEKIDRNKIARVMQEIYSMSEQENGRVWCLRANYEKKNQNKTKIVDWFKSINWPWKLLGERKKWDSYRNEKYF